MWFDTWADLARILLTGVAAYVVLVAMVRLSGKRALSQLNAFDFVVSVAIGSVLATTLLNADVALAEGVIALGLLLGLQYLVASISTRWPRARDGVTSQPTLLLADGHIQYETLRGQRLTESELRQVVRMHGIGDLSQVKAVILESNGEFSVITTSQYGDGSATAGLDLV